MDPQANILELLGLAQKHIEGDQHADECEFDIVRMSELIEALDCWIRAGGALPQRWQATTTTNNE